MSDIKKETAEDNNSSKLNALSDEDYNAKIKIDAVRRWVKCLSCDDHVRAKLVLGSIAAPDVHKLADKLYFLCRGCGNFVGSWHNKGDIYLPVGTIPTKEIQAAREVVYENMQILIDSGRYNRTALYNLLSRKLGWRSKFGVAKIDSIKQAKNITKMLKKISAETAKPPSDLM